MLKEIAGGLSFVRTVDAQTDLEQWLAEARCGSSEALGKALETYRHYLLLVANREISGDLRTKAGASDLVQDTFLEAQRDFTRFDGTAPTELRAWLRRILLNNLANFRRCYRATGKRQVEREVSLDVPDSRGDLRDHLTADVETASRQAVQQEEAEILERALHRLPEHYRQVIVWRNREGQAFEEISRRLNRSPDAARMLWYRAVEQLQQELKQNA